MGRLIYKAVPARFWREAEAERHWHGAPVDLADGYIHFSAAGQLTETLARHFAGEQDLLLLAVDEAALGSALRWEISRGGAIFPHLYAPLSVEDVAWVEPLPLDANGHHILPERVH